MGALALAAVLLAVAAGGRSAGDVIAVARTGGGIVLIDPSGHAVAAVTHGNDWAPAWSPDGRRLAFVRTTDGRRSFHVYVVGADGRGLRRLTHGRFDDRPAWSPDGSSIAYEAMDGIHVIHADGSDDRRVFGTGVRGANFTDAYAWYPAWTRDGKLSYAFHPEGPPDWPASCRARGAHCGWVLAAGRPVVRGRDAHWSPDGRTVVFTPPDGGVAVVSAAGGRSRFLGKGYTADWSADGKRIVYARLGQTAAGDSIWIMNADGSGAHRILQRAQTPAWRP